MQYHAIVILGCAVGLVLARRRLAVIGCCVLLYLIGPTIFAGVYGHSYYAVANLVFFLVAMGLSIVGLLERGGWRKAFGVALFVATLAAAVYQHQTLYLPLQHHPNRWPLRIAEMIRLTTKPDDVIVIYGYEWSPEIAYYAQRRALMLPHWVDAKEADAAFRELDKLSVGAMVIIRPEFGEGWRPPSAEEYAKQRQRWKLSSAACYRDQACEVYPPVRCQAAYQDYWQAKTSLSEGKLDAALDRFNLAIAGFPDDPAFYFGRAQCYILRNDLTNARNDCARAVELAPTAFFWSQRAIILLGASEQPGGNPVEVWQLLGDALASADQVILAQPQQPLGYRIRSQVLSALGRTEEASGDARRASDLSIPPARTLDSMARLVIHPEGNDAGKRHEGR
jgi:tetratricopeptide (TPR) repeat protein